MHKQKDVLSPFKSKWLTNVCKGSLKTCMCVMIKLDPRNAISLEKQTQKKKKRSYVEY